MLQLPANKQRITRDGVGVLQVSFPADTVTAVVPIKTLTLQELMLCMLSM